MTILKVLATVAGIIFGYWMVEDRLKLMISSMVNQHIRPVQETIRFYHPEPPPWQDGGRRAP